MTKLYFVCMGNYYRSRLAEELALYYAAQNGIEIEVDSGGLSHIPNPNHPGPMAKQTLAYLAQKGVQPQHTDRYPKNCDWQAVSKADIVICTDEDEQRYLFTNAFPEYKGELICWRARDYQYDPWLETPVMIDRNVEKLIKSLAEKST